MKIKNIYADFLKEVIFNAMKNNDGIVGYALAKNYRLLNQELIEYQDIKQKLFKKYGKDNEGTLIIEKDTKEYNEYLKEISKFDEIEIDIDFMKVDEEDFKNSKLTGEEMNILMDYMLEMEDL